MKRIWARCGHCNPTQLVQDCVVALWKPMSLAARPVLPDGTVKCTSNLKLYIFFRGGTNCLNLICILTWIGTICYDRALSRAVNTTAHHAVYF